MYTIICYYVQSTETYRGESFRRAYGRVGEIRSIIPYDVHIMALTATATRNTRTDVIRMLSMKQCVIVSRSPHKRNIILDVKMKPELTAVLLPIVEELKEQGASAKRLIIYCKRYGEVSNVYRFFKRKLGKNFTVPACAPDLPGFRLVDMYTKCTETSVKESIVTDFSEPDSNLRVVVATIAFGMGLDCPNVSQIIHWGPSSAIEDYVQEIGRAGRNAEIQAKAVLYFHKSDQQFTSAKMMEYCRNNCKCRRELLFCAFDEYDRADVPAVMCKCCDICAAGCTCSSCDL